MTDTIIASGVQRLAKTPLVKNPLSPSDIPDPVQAKTGVGKSSKGTGISSPLTETKYADREYYATFTLTSTDGLFVMELKRIKKMKFNDADSRFLEIDFADKP
jgi:hypothetical protein